MFDMGISVESSKSFDEVATDLEKVISEHGFRVLAVHDVQETLKEKGLEVAPTRIIELCNAKFAHAAMQKDVNVTLFMPCKIVVRSDNGKTIMTLARPSMIAQMLPEAGLDQLAGGVEEIMKQMMDDVK